MEKHHELQIDQCWQRLQAARLQQYRPRTTETLEDPITGRRVTLASSRQHRHVETDALPRITSTRMR